jgi:hypothetical protein
MIGRKTLKEILAELEAALSGPGGLLEGSPTDGTAKDNEVVESLRRFLAAKPRENGEEPHATVETAEAPAS